MKIVKNGPGKKYGIPLDFYNRERKPPKPDWQSPVEFEEKWHRKEGRPKIK